MRAAVSASSRGGGSDAVLFAVTGRRQEDYRRSNDAGYYFHLVKPIEPADLRKSSADS